MPANSRLRHNHDAAESTGKGKMKERMWQVEAEHPNLEAALGHMAAKGDADGVLRMAGWLGNFWFRRGHLRVGRRWLEWALERNPVRGRGLAAWRWHVWA